MLPAKTDALMRVAGLRHKVNREFVVTAEIIRTQRVLPYDRMWKLAHDRKWFHIQFEDLSIIQFQNNPSPSFHFIECPLDVPSLGDFIASLGKEYRARYDSVVAELYDEAIETAGLRPYITPIRFDRDFGSYRSGVHPAAHLHIGIDNNIRLGLAREMTPLSFLLFILRQKYPSSWERLLRSNLASSLVRSIRDSLPPLPKQYGQDFDFCEIALI